MNRGNEGGEYERRGKETDRYPLIGTIMSIDKKEMSERLYFVLTNSLATVKTMMNEIFQDLTTEGVVSVYINDILFTNLLE
jgi:hypothetical protein